MTDPNTAARERAERLAEEGSDPRTVAAELSLQSQHLDALGSAVLARRLAAHAEEELIETTSMLAASGVEPATPPEEGSPEALHIEALALRQESERLAREGGRLAELGQIPAVEGGAR
jgi:hypothetical protein